MAKTTAQRKFEKATKLWQILGMALHDLRTIEKKRGYKVDMNYWHEPQGNKCVVCLAGSVMANRLGAKKKEGMEPYDTEYANKLNALNCLRMFDLAGAYSYISNGAPENDIKLSVTRTERLFEKEKTCGSGFGYIDYGDPNWWPAMRRLHQALKKADI